MTPPFRLAVLGLLGLASCSQFEFASNWFDGPTAATVLDPEDESPFNEPIAFVANSRSGTIVPLDMKNGTLLSDQAAASFLPPRIVATGDTRLLADVAAWGRGDAVTVLAVDTAHGVLVEADYIVGQTETREPIPPTLSATEPAFLSADPDAGGSAALEGLTLRHGYSTTEDWRLEFNGAVWTAFGSRSGRQARTFSTGEPWRSDRREIELEITGTPAAGDRFEFSVETGLREHDLGARPLGLLRIPETDTLVVGLWDEALDRGELVVWDLLSATESARIPLDEGGQPWRFAWDDEPGVLYVADARLPQVYAVALDLEDPIASPVSSIATVAPIQDLAVSAYTGEPLFGDVPHHHLFVAPVGLSRVDVYDLETGDWLDTNPLDGRLGGVDLGSPVVGLSASTAPVRLQSEGNNGAREDAAVVVVTTFDGSVRMLEADTGCLAIDVLGPRVSTGGSTEGVDVIDNAPASDPVLYIDPATSSAISPQACGGILKTEAWTLTYDENAGNWLAEGTRSGEQAGRVTENQRYVTDDGSMSLLVLSGNNPSSDGDRFEFNSSDGVLRLTEISRQGTANVSPVELPAAPVVFTMESGPSGGNWDLDRTQTHALIPVTGSDFVVRMRPQAWKVEVLYE